MLERVSPDGKHIAKWRWGGEMWMSGPEWGWLSVDGREEIEGATSDVLWSQDSLLLAFVKLHIEQVPNRQGAEGFSFRVGLMRMVDHQVRYCLGNRGLARMKLETVTQQHLGVLVDGVPTTVSLGKIRWGNP